MPRIPRTEATNSLRLANQPTMSPDALTGPGRALQGLGRSIAGLADDFQAMSAPSDQDLFNAQMVEVKAHNDASLYVDERKATFSGDVDPSEWRNETMAGVGEIYRKYRSEIPAHPKIQQRFDLNAERFRGGWDRETHGVATQATIQRNVEGAASTLSTLIARTPPDDPAFARILDTVDQHVARIPGASTKAQAWVRAQAAQAAYARMQESVAKDPVGAVDAAKQIINTWGKELEAPPQPSPAGRASVGPQSNIEMQDFTAGRKFADLPAANVSNIVLHDVSGDPSNRRLPKGGNIPHYHITFDDNGIYNEISLDQRAPHAARFNKNSIGIAHIGFEDDKLSPQAIANGAKAVKMVAEKFGISPENILTHPGAGPSATKSGGKDPKEASWKSQVLAYIEQNMGGIAGGGSATASKGGMTVDLTAYSPQAGGDKMEGGYAAARPGPDGKAEVSTLADVAAGRSKYVTVAGNASHYGKTYIIPEITFVDASGNRKTLKNVEAVVHDTGSAFKDAPEGRFDIPIDRDATDRQMSASHTMWKKQRVQFVEKGKDQPTPMAERGIAQYAGSVKVADASGSVPQSAQDGQRPANTVPGQQTAQLGPNEWTRSQQAAQDAAPPGTIPSVKAAGGQAWARPGIRTEIIEKLMKDLPTLEKARAKALESMIERAEKSAGDGYILPANERMAIVETLKRAGTPLMLERFGTAEAAAAMTATMKQMTPAQLSGQVAMLRQAMNTAGAPPETIAKAKAIEALQTRMTKELHENSVGWAAEAGLIPAQVPITPQTFSVDVLRQRAQAVGIIAQHYGPEYKQFFSKEEKATLEASFNRGGNDMLGMMAMMHEAFGDDMPRAVAEIAPKAPEAVRAGFLLTSGGSTQAAKDIAATIARRADPNFKNDVSMKGLMAGAEADADAMLSDVYRNYPKQLRDATMRAAEAIYLARVKDTKTYDSELFRTALHEAMGGRVNGNGKEFGGVVQTAKGTFGGDNGGAIVLPSNMRKDLWREIFYSITTDDLQQANHPVPVDAEGTPLRMSQVVSGTIEQLGVGRYGFKLPRSDGQTGWVRQFSQGPTKARSEAATRTPTETFELDMTKLSPILRSRIPEAFWRE